MISFDSLLQFGEIFEDVLEIKESFLLQTSDFYEGCALVCALSSYCGEKAPEISFLITVKGQKRPIYKSHSYRIGKADEYVKQTWRVPPLILPDMTFAVKVYIPKGSKLYLKEFKMTEDAEVKRAADGVRHNAHLGFWGMAPDNTMPAFKLAADCGFSVCIAVPKVTGDGVFVCIHDDTINKTARDMDGNAPKEAIRVSDKTYDELLFWEYGSYKNEIYKGTKLPLLSDFFDLCAKSGMSPMFSTHPPLTVEQWKEVKSMLESRGLLNKFHIKSFYPDALKTAYSIFGTEIDGYTYDVGSWKEAHLETLLNIGIDTEKCRVGMELQFSHYTKKIAAAIKKAGFFASAWNIKRRKFSRYEKLMSWGVSEFTEDYHCSMGLSF